MAKHDDLRNLFRQQEKDIKALKDQQNLTQRELQGCCPHTYIAQAQDRDNPRYMRICEICGKEEEAAWEGGFKILKSKRPMVVDWSALWTIRRLDYDIEP